MSTSMHQTSTEAVSIRTQSADTKIDHLYGVIEGADTWTSLCGRSTVSAFDVTHPRGSAGARNPDPDDCTECNVFAHKHDLTVVGEERNRPSWSDPARDWVDRSRRNQPEDDGVEFSAVVDEWVVEEPWLFKPGNRQRKCTVKIMGFRHDMSDEQDWPDYVHVDLETDGCEGDTMQKPSDLRRLAEALVKGAELLEASHS